MFFTVISVLVICPMKCSAKSGDKKKKIIMIDVKKEIIKKHEKGLSVVDIVS